MLSSWSGTACTTAPSAMARRRPESRHIGTSGNSGMRSSSSLSQPSGSAGSRIASHAGSAAAGLTGALLGWGWFEAGWVRLRTLELEVPGLPAELDGLRVAHLSDFHFGVPSRGRRAVERAVDWAAARKPDLVTITGDLLTHPRGERRLRSLVGGSRNPSSLSSVTTISQSRVTPWRGSRTCRTSGRHSC